MDKKNWIVFPLTIAFVLGLVLLVRHFDPAPPNHLTITIGDDQGDLQSFIKQYQRIFKEDGVKLIIKSFRFLKLSCL